MAYKVAQLRKNNILQYGIPVKYNLDMILSVNKYRLLVDRNFYDIALITNNNSTTTSPPTGGSSVVSFLIGLSYFFDFSIRCIPKNFYSDGSKDYEDADVLQFTLLLKHSNSSLPSSNNTNVDTDYQLIGTYRVPMTAIDHGDTADLDSFLNSPQYINFSCVFTPQGLIYDTLVLRVQRDRFDILGIQYQRNWSLFDIILSGTLSYELLSEKERIAKAKIDSDNTPTFICNTLTKLINLIPSSASGAKGWLKFGYQSRPGNLIVVNGLPIRVGRSGIYEFNNGLKITKFMIAGSTIDAFLLDYAYDNT